MLKRPTRPLPRKFNRPVTEQTRAFAQKRHKRRRQHSMERWKRMTRRLRTAAVERLAFARRWIKYVVAALVVFAACLFLFSPILHVREIRVVRTEGRVDIAKVINALHEFYGRHMLLVSARDITTHVRQVVPDAKDVIVSKHYPSQLSVRITLVPLVAKLTIDPPLNAAPVSGSGSGPGTTTVADYLTENGVLVSIARPAGSQPLPTIRIVDWGVRPVPLSPVLAPEFLDRMRRAEGALALEFSQQIVSRTVYLRAREFHLDTPKLSFWFDLRSPLEEQLQRLRTFLTVVKFPEVKNYIDLRLIGKVVYK